MNASKPTSIIVLALVLCMTPDPGSAQQTRGNNAQVVLSPHNLSTSGQGPYRSLTINQVCVFCHAPHSDVPNAPLWNRRDSGQTYVQYGSSTLVSIPGQPTGSSRLCLACHDGTIALEQMTRLPDEARQARSETKLTSRGNLGTDLADDHPISFTYSANLAAAQGQLRYPDTVPLPLQDEMVHCDTCHDPHDNSLQPFLRLPSEQAEICTACHVPAGLAWDWTSSAHAISSQTAHGNRAAWSERKQQWRGTTVAENSCFNCHAPHNAATPQRLISDLEEATCFRCHDGSMAEKDLQAEFLKPSRHPVGITPDPEHLGMRVEDPSRTGLHSECSDCHNPHAVRADTPMVTVNRSEGVGEGLQRVPLVNGLSIGVSGLGSDGRMKQTADYQYETCFKCHGQPTQNACQFDRCSTAQSMSHTRVDGVYNLRDKVDPVANPTLRSYHPIVENNPENDGQLRSLKTELELNDSNTLIYCTDCHNGENSSAGTGSGPEGPHGSIYPPLLADRYTLNTVYSGPGSSLMEAALCYKCHDPGRLTNGVDASASIHRSHEANGTCITCHDPHGSTRFEHLLNFETNNNLVPPGDDPAITGAGIYSEPTWEATPEGGKCWLQCHNGPEHLGAEYPESAVRFR